MSIKVTIKDGKGSSRENNIGTSNDLLVTNTGLPPSNLKSTLKPFTMFMGNGVNIDMRVVGTLTTPVDFVISSSNEGDRYINALAFTIADASATFNKFGNVVALTNGCQLIYQDSELGDVIIGDDLKSNFDFVQLCNFNPSFGDGTTAFKASNVIGASEAYVPVLEGKSIYGLPFGLLIPESSTKKLILRVRDDTTAIDRFDVKAFGYDKIEVK